MISEQAIVTRRDGNRIELDLLRESACGGCDLNRSCGTGALGRLLGRRKKPLVIESRQVVKPGDRVTLTLSEQALVRVSLLVYGLPLVSLVCAGVVTEWIFAPSDEWVAGVCGLGFYLGFKLASHMSGSLAQGEIFPGLISVEVNAGAKTGS